MIIIRKCRSFEQAIRDYRRLCNPRRVGKVCADWNRLSATVILREGLGASPVMEAILKQLADAPQALTAEAVNARIAGKLGSTQTLLARLASTEPYLVEREIWRSRPITYAYRLSDLGRMVMACEVDDGQ